MKELQGIIPCTNPDCSLPAGHDGVCQLRRLPVSALDSILNAEDNAYIAFLKKHGALKPYKKPALSCSFCGKQETEVKRLVAGPTVFICDECISLCNEIMADPYVPPHRDSGTSGMWMCPTWVMPRDYYEAQMAQYEWSD